MKFSLLINTNIPTIRITYSAVLRMKKVLQPRGKQIFRLSIVIKNHNTNAVWQRTCMVLNPVMIDNFALLFNFMTVSRASNRVTVLSLSSFIWSVPDYCCLWSESSFPNIWFSSALSASLLNVFMLNSADHEIFSAYKYKKIQKYKFYAQLS